MCQLANAARATITCDFACNVGTDLEQHCCNVDVVDHWKTQTLIVVVHHGRRRLCRRLFIIGRCWDFIFKCCLAEAWFTYHPHLHVLIASYFNLDWVAVITIPYFIIEQTTADEAPWDVWIVKNPTSKLLIDHLSAFDEPLSLIFAIFFFNFWVWSHQERLHSEANDASLINRLPIQPRVSSNIMHIVNVGWVGQWGIDCWKVCCIDIVELSLTIQYFSSILEPTCFKVCEFSCGSWLTDRLFNGIVHVCGLIPALGAVCCVGGLDTLIGKSI